MCVQTTVPCVPAGVFRCLLVVTMRPIPAGMLNAAVKITHLNPLAHGAPIHIGDPGKTNTHHVVILSLRGHSMMIYYLAP